MKYYFCILNKSILHIIEINSQNVSIYAAIKIILRKLHFNIMILYDMLYVNLLLL
jgi:hypothetical protein